MATKVYKEEAIEFQDGTTVTFRPLPLKKLRAFMEVVKRFEDLEGEDPQSLDIMLDAAQVAISAFNPKYAEDRDNLEDVLDIPTIWRIFEIAGGVTQGAGNPMARTAGTP